MDGQKLTAETPTTSLAKATELSSSVVFQPPKLTDLIEVIDLMGTVASRVREDKSSDLPSAAGPRSGKAGQTQNTSARDAAIAAAPPPAVMQQKLIRHLEQEVSRVEKQAKSLSHSRENGAAFVLAELYKKIRRLTSLITDILQASAEMIKRFYISVFIDNQPLVVTGGTLKESDAT